MIDPFLIEIPEQFETERLIIRAPRIGDGREINAAVVESLAELSPWMAWAQTLPSVEDSEINIRQACARWIERHSLRLLGFSKQSGELVLNSGLHNIKWDVPKFEIGYWQRTKFCGQGLASEGVQAIANFAFQTLKAERVEIRCDARNEKSSKVARSAGFELEARLKNESRDWVGQLSDTLIWARVR